MASTVAGFNLAFFPMFLVGLDGMNRRVASYPSYLEGMNAFISLAAFLLGLSFVIHVANLAYSWVRGPAAEANPWHGKGRDGQRDRVREPARSPELPGEAGSASASPSSSSPTPCSS